MIRRVTAPAGPVVAVLIGTTLLAGATPRPDPAVAPAKSAPHASPEPTEAQLPPVDPAWRQNGWHAVVPHGYVLRRLAAARIRPEASAPAAFWLQGGVRVPILEQRSRWWRVGWTHGRTGWLPAVDLQPHASFILIDVPSGRVIRRLAAKGEQGPVAAGGFLWSLSDTGITRTSLAEPPAFWSNPIRPDRDGSLPDESVWTPDRSMFYMRATSEDKGPLLEVSAPTGAARRVSDPGADLRLVLADAEGHILIESRRPSAANNSPSQPPTSPASPARVPLPRSRSICRYDVRHGREFGRTAGRVVAASKAGSVYTEVEYVGGGRELIHYSRSLRPITRIPLPGHWTTACLSADERVLALSDAEGSDIELRRADTLKRIITLHPGSQDGLYPRAVTGGAGGWWVLAVGEPDSDGSITHYNRHGRPIRTWNANGLTTITSANGRWVFIAGDSDLQVIDTARGTARKIPYSWRPPLPARYLPAPSDPDTPTHLEISRLTLTPDGRTLLLTEWLSGDPQE